MIEAYYISFGVGHGVILSKIYKRRGNVREIVTLSQKWWNVVNLVSNKEVLYEEPMLPGPVVLKRAPRGILASKSPENEGYETGFIIHTVDLSLWGILIIPVIN